MNDKASDILEIQMLKARYARFGDTKDWAEFRKCLSDDFHCRVEGAPRASADAPADYVVSSADAFVANAQKMISAIQAIHQLSLPEITIASDTTATGIWALHDYLLAPHCIFRGWGHYHDEYVKISGHWKIRKSAVTRIRVEETWL
ncbi:nuclear transport factor 2 family protein [Novosphingobium sp. BL-52-GroH]|uniref:nuclear transport factor 2 family protein n=1 Tax=Novosphingobium sp. BL-52-GroH TaxID=3349877 RepID=UPI00384D1370